VTGGAGGIGAAISRTLAERGYAVAVADIDGEAAVAVADALPCAVGLEVDVTDREAIQQACDDAVRQLGPLGVWVSNAGISQMAPFVDLTETQVDAVFAVNAKAPLLCGQIAARKMLAQGEGGCIINVSSMAGKRGSVRNLAHYVTSKFAVVGLTQAMARELAGDGIRVNCVCPGHVMSPMQDRELIWEAELEATTPELARERLVTEVPLGRLQRPADVAGVVAFLVSEDAWYITGEAMAVNGGAFMD
jgi:NAD(P)-dependent dehydrogenase (short-subunit alcohol dehydrogenase family)